VPTWRSAKHRDNFTYTEILQKQNIDQKNEDNNQLQKYEQQQEDTDLFFVLTMIYLSFNP
jgi:hypothetical protein